jgi:hypothetical protein
MGQELSPVVKVKYLGAVQERCGISDETPVASEPQGFGTHDTHPAPGVVSQDSAQGMSEGVAGHVVRVTSEGGVPEGHIRGVLVPATKAAEFRLPAIGDPGVWNPRFKF